jgi:predicted O-methyltransferase YrrM
MSLTNREKLLLLTTLFSSWWTLRRMNGLLRAHGLKQEEHYRQTEALFSLFAQIQFQAPLPPMRRWAISPDFATLIVGQIREQKPVTVVEVGSGISTLISGYCLKQQGTGQVIAIDHDSAFASETENNLKAHGLERVAKVICAPLQPLPLNGKTWQWYDTHALHEITDIDLLIVDGPPQMYNPSRCVRYPALPCFFERLSENACILMDDAARADEKAITGQWLREYPVELVRRYDTERGAVLFRKRALHS